MMAATTLEQPALAGHLIAILGVILLAACVGLEQFENQSNLTNLIKLLPNQVRLLISFAARLTD